MTLQELQSRWQQKRQDFERLDVTVRGATLIDELLADVQQVTSNRDDEFLNLSQAAIACGYTADHIGRLVRVKKLRNHGRPNAPRVRRGDLPQKAGQPSAVALAGPSALRARGVYSPSQIARSLATSGAAT